MNAIKNVLVTTDLSENATRAIPFAVAIAHENNAALHLVYVDECQTPYLTDGSVAIPQVEWMVAEREGRRLQIKNLASTITEREMLSVVPHFMEGPPAREILSVVDQVKPDLIVISTHGRTGLARLLLGSVTETILRHSPCPVLCVKSSGPTTLSGSDILLTTDLSENSLTALPLAETLVNQSGGALHLLLVLDDEMVMPTGVQPGIPVQWMIEEHRQMEQKLQKLVLELASRRTAKVVPHVRHGSPSEEIMALATQLQIGCIVIATHGRTGLKRLLFGSVAENVIRQSTCPVLAVRSLNPETVVEPALSALRSVGRE